MMPTNNTTTGEDKHHTGIWTVPCISAPELLSMDTIIELKRIVCEYEQLHGFLAAAVCVFNALSNLAIIVVLTRTSLTFPTKTVFVWIAVFQFLRAAVYLPYAIYFFIIKKPGLPSLKTDSNLAWILFLLIFYPVSVLCHNISIWFAVALATFSCFSICIPTKAKTWCTERRVKSVTKAIIFLAVVLCIPNATKQTYEVKVGNSSDVEKSSNDSYYNGSSGTFDMNDSVSQHTVTPSHNTSNMTSRGNPNVNSSTVYIGDTLNHLTQNNKDAIKLARNIFDTASVTPSESGTEYINPNITELNARNRETTVFVIIARDLPEIVDIVDWWIRGVVFKLVPCFLLFVMSPVLFYAMDRNNINHRRRVSMSFASHSGQRSFISTSMTSHLFEDDDANETHSTRMLFSLIVLMTLTELPLGILQLLNIIAPCLRKLVYMNLTKVIDVTNLYVRSVTLPTYLYVSDPFSDAFRDLFCPCMKLCGKESSVEENPNKHLGKPLGEYLAAKMESEKRRISKLHSDNTPTHLDAISIATEGTAV